MPEFINNPVLQSTLIPITLALLFLFIFLALAPRWKGLSVLLGFYPASLLIAGVQLYPLNSTRKILILGIIFTCISLFFTLKNSDERKRLLLTSALLCAATLWLLWPLLLQAKITEAFILFSLSLAYLLWTILLLDTQRTNTPLQMLSISVFSTGLAISAALSASALIGQLSGALAAATGAVLLVVLLFKNTKHPDMLMLPIITMASLLGLTAVIYAKLPWSCLFLLATIPMTSRLPLTLHNNWIKLLIQLLIMMAITAAAIYIAWNSADNSLYY